jgi:hypothetical protein
MKEHLKADIPQPGSSSRLGVVEDLQLRVANLEKLLHVSVEASGLNVSAPQVGSQSPAFSLTNDAGQPQTTAPEPYTLIVKGQRSRYHGPNDRVTLLSQVCSTLFHATDAALIPSFVIYSSKRPRIL